MAHSCTIPVPHFKSNLPPCHENKHVSQNFSHMLEILSPLNSKPLLFYNSLSSLFRTDSFGNHFVPSAGHGITTLLFATLSMMASPGSAKDGASVRTEKQQ